MNRRTTFVVSLSMLVAACAGATTTTTTVATPATTPAESTTSTTTTTAVETTSTDTESGFPVSIDSGGFTTTIDSEPTAIISLSPTATEMLFAVGAGDQVVAVDEFSYFPPEAPVTDLSGFTPNLEAIVSYEPDLVILQGDQDGIVGALGGVGVPVLILPAAVVVEDALAQIRTVGRASGNEEAAEELAAEMERQIDAFVSSVDVPDEPLTYYHELGSDGGGSFYSVTSQTFIGEVFGAFGLENVADPADTDGFGYPLLSGEFVLEADPDFIFFTNCCGDTPESIASRGGWADLTAVQAGQVHELDDDLASRWGPRMVQFFELVAGAVAEATG